MSRQGSEEGDVRWPPHPPERGGKRIGRARFFFLGSEFLPVVTKINGYREISSIYHAS
jgi:hypothetical protein